MLRSVPWALLAALILVPVRPAAAQVEVLIIWDTNNADVTSLAQAIGSAGMAVTLSATSETAYDGSNPAPTGFDAVIHLNGSTWDAGDEMPLAGQQALVDFVDDGGVYVAGEWNAYELSQGRMQAMDDLILSTYAGEFYNATTMDEIPAQAGHPILANVPASIAVDSSFTQGQVRTFASDPPVVLMQDP